MFSARAARTGGTLRRKIASVEKNASMSQLERAVRARGFHLLIIEDQAVVLCNPGRVKLVC
jgi:hypothetical protein